MRYAPRTIRPPSRLRLAPMLAVGLAVAVAGCADSNEAGVMADANGKKQAEGVTLRNAPKSSADFMKSSNRSAMQDPGNAKLYRSADGGGAAGFSGMAKSEPSRADKSAPALTASPALDAASTVEAPNPAEAYSRIVDNGFKRVAQEPLSTFSIDVDTASYANVRRFLTQGMMPPRDAVRVEELINYFPYDYTPPTGDNAFAANVEIARCPWNAEHRLARIALKGKEIKSEKRPAANLVFLLDVSGSMHSPDKLPLLKEALRMLVERLGENDRVAIVVYAGAEGLALPSTSAEHKREILSALDSLQAGGSTNGGAGIKLAYDVAVQNFIKGCTNRVILCTDGDFNVGATSPDQLKALIQEKAKSKVFLSVLGFGQGNLKDATMEKLADLGNGNYAYIDSGQEAKKVLVEQMSGTLVTIAKDVKIQVEFNPAKVGAYRLIGYENRMLATQDFDDDRKDAGEIGAGHSVTALYELVPPGHEAPAGGHDDLKYGKKPEKPAPDAGAGSDETLTVKIRFKAPEGDVSQKIEKGFTDDGRDFASASGEFKFASAVAGFGMLLRESPHKGNVTWAGVYELAQSGKGRDESGYRAEFLDLVRRAQALQPRSGR